jgi:hypothetical protein
MPNDVVSLTAEQNAWLTEVSGSLPKNRYPETKRALAKQFERANPFDTEGRIAGDVNRAEAFYKNGEFVAALEYLDRAGQTATELIAKSETYVQSDKHGGGIAPSKADEIGKERAAKSKELPDGLRDSEKADVYYANTPELRKKSEYKVQDGLLVGDDGKALDSTHGYSVSAEDGTMHHFDPRLGARKAGKALHHSSEVAGGAVTAAGEQITEAGLLRKVTDKSGHYKPDGEMIHNYVERLKNDGVKTHDESVLAVGDDGKTREATADELRSHASVQPVIERLEALRKKDDQLREHLQTSAAHLAEATEIVIKEEELAEIRRAHEALAESVSQERPRIKAEIDGLNARLKGELKTEHELVLKNGVGARNKDATVELYNSSTRFSPEEWEKVQGDLDAIQSAIVAKIGMKREAGQGFLEFPKMGDSGCLDNCINDMDKTNDYIGILLRVSEVKGQEYLSDKSKTHINLEVEQFRQTGGNAQAAARKQRDNVEILEKMNIQRGIPQALMNLGFPVAELSPQQQLALFETTDVVGKLKTLGVEDLKAFPGDKLVELAETPDSLVARIVALGGPDGASETLRKMGFVPTDLGPEGQLTILEKGITADNLRKLQDLDIPNPAKLPAATIIELLETSDILKDFEMIKPARLEGDADDILGVIRLLHGFRDRAKLKAHLNADDVDWDDWYGLYQLISGFTKADDERRRKDEEDQARAETLQNGAATLEELGFVPANYSPQKQLEILRYARQFRDFGGAKRLKALDIDLNTTEVSRAASELELDHLGGDQALSDIGFPPSMFLFAFQKLPYLELKKRFAGLGGMDRLNEIGIQRRIPAEEALMILECAALLKSRFGAEASDYPADKLPAVLAALENGESADDMLTSSSYTGAPSNYTGSASSYTGS